MTPFQYLLIVSGVLATALLVKTVVALVRSRRVAAVAKKAGLQYSRPDRFDLSRRVALRLAVPGAAEVAVRDVMYSTSPQGLLCVMTASFTVGTVGHRRQVRRVCVALDRNGSDLAHFQMIPGSPTPSVYEDGLSMIRQAVPQAAM
jgi:hypothetical protein